MNIDYLIIPLIIFFIIGMIIIITYDVSVKIYRRCKE